MHRKAEIRLGSTTVTFERRRIVFRDVHEPQMVVAIDEADAAELVCFIYQSSGKVRERLNVSAAKPDSTK